MLSIGTVSRYTILASLQILLPPLYVLVNLGEKTKNSFVHEMVHTICTLHEYDVSVCGNI